MAWIRQQTYWEITRLLKCIVFVRHNSIFIRIRLALLILDVHGVTWKLLERKYFKSYISDCTPIAKTWEWKTPKGKCIIFWLNVASFINWTYYKEVESILARESSDLHLTLTKKNLISLKHLKFCILVWNQLHSGKIWIAIAAT